MNLIIIAHPDDETLWFSSILLRNNCEVVLVTCGDSKDKKRREERRREFEKTMKLFSIKKYTILWHEDTENRLNLSKLEIDLRKFLGNNYEKIYTHGPYGETYNHQHHQDVSYVVHKIFKNQKVCSAAWNLFPDEINVLEKDEYILKKYIIGTIYEKEYEKLQDAYEISAIEKFIQLDFDEVDVYYWSCANFGDNHDYLSKYKDFWGFTSSPYEIERHDLIIDIIKKIPCKKILEIGAYEGVLTDKLSVNYQVDCVEKCAKYKKTLKEKGFSVIDSQNYADYDLVLLAQVLEYMPDYKKYLEKMNSKFILIDIIPSIERRKIIESVLSDRYTLIYETNLAPKWEPMYIGSKKKKLEIYRMGSNVLLFKKNKKK
jgi:LmbE family N-acetylglucosaminyl deacetylase